MDNFKSLGIDQKFIQALEELKITKPTEIQKQAIPYLLEEGQDFIGQAHTGTGKTAAFCLPILHKIDPNSDQVQALILTPTRELCQQIAKQIFKMTKHSEKIFTEAVYGGEWIEDQINKLQRRTHIIVATPGRLVDLLSRDVLDLSCVMTVVLDEADEMLNMGFKNDLDTILRTTSTSSYTWLFSATYPQDLRSLTQKYLAPNARKVQLNKVDVITSTLEHQYFICEFEDKMYLLKQLIADIRKQTGIVFCRTKASANFVHQQLRDGGIAADVLHGDLTQKEREKAVRQFKNGGFQVLVATDLFARGVDIPDVGYVVHFQLPDTIEYYTHRSGRTGRAGKKGLSIALVDDKELRKLKKIQTQLKLNLIRLN